LEDAEKKIITHVYSLVIIAGQFASLFAPISSLLVAKFTLVPAIRILYINAFIIMTSKAVILFCASRETGTGKVRMEETKDKNIFQLVGGYGGVFKIIAHSPGTIFSLFVSALVGAIHIINNTFWQVIVSKKLLIPDPLLPIFPIIKSVVAAFFLFVIVPHMTKGLLKLPLLVGFACYFFGQGILTLIPVEGVLKYPMLSVSLIFDGFGYSILAMLAESLVALHVNKAERARVMAIQRMIVLACTAPFGYIGGFLSELNRTYPFYLSLALLVIGFAVTLAYYKAHPTLPGEVAKEGEIMGEEADGEGLTAAMEKTVEAAD
jgi:hypothetical protein